MVRSFTRQGQLSREMLEKMLHAADLGISTVMAPALMYASPLDEPSVVLERNHFADADVAKSEAGGMPFMPFDPEAVDACMQAADGVTAD